jgi:RNA recognition motif-containing protein
VITVKKAIMEALELSPDGVIPIGDKSSPEDISSYFRGLSKADFRRAVGSLYKERLLVPSDNELKATAMEEREVKSVTINPNRITPSKSSSDMKLTMFIGNLPVSVNDKILQNTIDKVMGKGKALSIRLPLNDVGKPRGFAFVSFSTIEERDTAIKKIKNFDLMGRNLRTDRADGDSESDPSSSSPSPSDTGRSTMNRPVTRTVKQDIREESLEDIMGYGTDDMDTVPISRGPRGVERAREEKNGATPRFRRSAGDTSIRGKKVVRTLYVGNLAYEVTEKVLCDAIERITSPGAVVSCRIATDLETGRKKGFGYADFWNEDDAEKVITLVYGKYSSFY